MNKTGLKILVICLSGVCITSLVFAQDEWSIDSDKQLDVSLMSLKHKEKEIVNRNAWLQSEMRELEAAVNQMNEELIALEENKAFLSNSAGEYEELVKGLSIVEKQALRADMTIDQLESERRRIEVAIRSKEKILFNIQQKAGEYARRLENIKNQPMDRQVENDPLAAESNKYRLLTEKSIKSLSKLEANYQDMTRRHWKPQAKIDKLKEAQEELKLQLNLLEDELAIYDQEENMLRSQIKEINGVDQDQLSKLQREVNNLEARNIDLEKTLGLAQIKLQQNNIQFDVSNESTELLAENLGVIKKENQTLQDEINNLQSTLEKTGKF